jgi:hypothetical protein
MLKCPIHEFPRNIVINNFYARLSGYYKDYLDACFDGSFTSKDVDVKWNLLETIQNNIEDWDSNKGKGSGINYEYGCIKSLLDAGRMTTQLGTPKGRYDEYSSKFSLSKKPRFNRPVGKSQTSEGDAC